MDLISKHIRHIINANNDNSLAIFVGAGISMSSNINTFKLPSWNDLIHEINAMHQLSHPYLIRLYGIVLSDPLMMVQINSTIFLFFIYFF